MSQEVIRGIALPPAAQPGDPLARVDTPSLALDLAAFEANLRAMQAWADRHGVALRPTPRPTVSPGRAAPAGAGARAASAARRSARPCPSSPQACATSTSATRWWARPSWRCWPSWRAPRASASASTTPPTWRISRGPWPAPASRSTCWWRSTWAGPLRASDEATVLALAQQARDLPGVNFAGLQAYHGSVQHARGREERARICRDAARIAASHAQLLRKRHRLRHHHRRRHRQRRVRCRQRRLHRAAGRLLRLHGRRLRANEWGGPLTFQNSLFLLSTVMSTPAPDRAVLDAGLKSASAECGPPAVHGEPGLTCTAINDEHSVVRVEPAPSRRSLARCCGWCRRTSTRPSTCMTGWWCSGTAWWRISGRFRRAGIRAEGAARAPARDACHQAWERLSMPP